MQIGFAILSYDQPEQLLRLVKTLNKMFDSPPIGCHHNFNQCLLDEEIFPANVDFIRPHINTRWGHISTPLAALKIFSLLAKKYQPDWFILLSGSDYPVRKAEEIIEDLSRTDFDAFLDSRNIESGAPPPRQTAEHGFARPGWISVEDVTNLHSLILSLDRSYREAAFGRSFLFGSKIYLFGRRSDCPNC
jgi:hypothetical protein